MEQLPVMRVNKFLRTQLVGAQHQMVPVIMHNKVKHVQLIEAQLSVMRVNKFLRTQLVGAQHQVVPVIMHNKVKHVQLIEA